LPQSKRKRTRTDDKPSLLPLVVLAGAFALLAGLLFAGALKLQHQRQARSQPVAAVRAPAPPLPTVTGLDQAGDTWATTDLAGRWTLLFFGYTSCPDVCPQTMAVLNQAYARLAATAAVQQSTQIVMVSVDPDVDTPQRLSAWLGSFDPALTGVHVEPEALKTLAQALGIHIMTRADHEAHGHTGADLRLVDHTPSVLLIDPELRPRRALSGPHTPSGIVTHYLALRNGS